MAEYIAKKSAARCPTHPGAILREDVIPALAMTKVDVANALGISRQHLYDVLNEKKPVSPDVAARLGNAFGNGPGIWLRMQASYDAWHAERHVDVSRVRKLAAA